MLFQLEIHRDCDDDRLDIVVESESTPSDEKILKFIEVKDIGFDPKHHKYYLSEVFPEEI